MDTWMRGVLSPCVVAVVADGETYGYLIAQRLHAAGLGTVEGGTLYPILSRLEQEGLLTSRWEAGDAGPGRKYFTVTPAGERALREPGDEWTTFTGRATALESHLGDTGEDPVDAFGEPDDYARELSRSSPCSSS